MTAKVTETTNIAAEPDLKARIMAGEVFVARGGLQQAGLFDEIIADSVASVRALVGSETTDKILAVGWEKIHEVVAADKIPALTEAIYQIVEAKAPLYLKRLMPATFGVSQYYFESAPNVRFHIPYKEARAHQSLYATFAEKRGEGKLTAHGPHRDSWLDCPDNGFNIWIALGRVKKGNGLTVYLKEYNETQAYTEIGEVTDEVPLTKPANFDLEPGDFIVFHTDHLHGSELNRTDETRFVISFRMAFDKPHFPLGHHHSYRHSGLADGPLAPFAALPALMQPSFVRSAFERAGRKLFPREKSASAVAKAPPAEVTAADLVVGEIRPIDETTCVAKLGEGRLVAFSRRCPHKGADLSNGFIDGDRIVCPWHNVPFDPASGASSCEALRPLVIQDVAVEDGKVRVKARAKKGAAKQPALSS